MNLWVLSQPALAGSKCAQSRYLQTIETSLLYQNGGPCIQREILGGQHERHTSARLGLSACINDSAATHSTIYLDPSSVRCSQATLSSSRTASKLPGLLRTTLLSFARRYQSADTAQTLSTRFRAGLRPLHTLAVIQISITSPSSVVVRSPMRWPKTLRKRLHLSASSSAAKMQP